MKPDINNPGQVEVTPKPTESELQLQPSPEQAIDMVGEKPIASVGSTASSASTTVPVVAPPPVTTSVATNQAVGVAPSSAKDQFESQLAQLPAEDSDVIEKVWVDKADEIVEKTQDDPFLQDEAQHSLSRAYLKKRFNLDVD